MFYDLLIRNGTIVDGLGGEPHVGAVASTGGVIVAVGSVHGEAAREIDATGLLVTPGFVDLHTHYDGQAIWSDRMTPSSAHGVTTAVMGQRGVDREPPTDEDPALMRKLAEEAILAGALGFGSSRLTLHKTSSGQPIPSYEAECAEIQAIARGVDDAAAGSCSSCQTSWRATTRARSRRCSTSSDARARTRGVNPLAEACDRLLDDGHAMLLVTLANFRPKGRRDNDNGVELARG